MATDRLANVAINSIADIEKALKICDPKARRLKRKDRPAKNKLNLTKVIRVLGILNYKLVIVEGRVCSPACLAIC